MRFNEVVYFVKNSNGSVYNPEIGEWVEGEEVKTHKVADVSDIGLELSVQLFGNYESTRKIIRLQKPYTEPFDYLVYKDQKYHHLMTRQRGKSFYVGMDSIDGR